MLSIRNKLPALNFNFLSCFVGFTLFSIQQTARALFWHRDWTRVRTSDYGWGWCLGLGLVFRVTVGGHHTVWLI